MQVNYKKALMLSLSGVLSYVVVTLISGFIIISVGFMRGGELPFSTTTCVIIPHVLGIIFVLGITLIILKQKMENEKKYEALRILPWITRNLPKIKYRRFLMAILCGFLSYIMIKFLVGVIVMVNFFIKEGHISNEMFETPQLLGWATAGIAILIAFCVYKLKG